MSQHHSPTGELDITECQQRWLTWSQSTDELLTIDTQFDAESINTGISTSTGNCSTANQNSQGSQIKDSHVSLHMELSDQHVEGLNSVEQTPDFSRQRSSPTLRSGPEIQRLEQFESSTPDNRRPDKSVEEYELEEISFRPVGSQSIERLVPVPNLNSTDHDGSAVTKTLPSKTPLPAPKLRPDYKPVPLRWYFYVFMICLIGGMFAFLEYQIHQLPPTHYTALEFDIPGGGDTPRKAAPTPIPPEESFPGVVNPATKFCGWTAPKWTKEPWTDSLPGDSAYQNYILAEVIDRFHTNDPSWCPCEIHPTDEWMGVWGIHEWSTNDRGCREVMQALEMFYGAHYGNRWRYQEVEVGKYSWDDLPSELYWTYDKPPLPTQAFWKYPERNEKGEVLLPMEVRTVAQETRDVFGNAVSPGNTALFPQAYRPKHLADGTFNPCWEDVYSFSPVPSWTSRTGPPCTETPTSYSTVWWTLPLSRPTIVSSSSEPAATSDTSSPTSLETRWPDFVTATRTSPTASQLSSPTTGASSLGTGSFLFTSPSVTTPSTAAANRPSTLRPSKGSDISSISGSSLPTSQTPLPETQVEMSISGHQEPSTSTQDPLLPIVLPNTTTVPPTKTSTSSKDIATTNRESLPKQTLASTSTTRIFSLAESPHPPDSNPPSSFPPTATLPKESTLSGLESLPTDTDSIFAPIPASSSQSTFTTRTNLNSQPHTINTSTSQTKIPLEITTSPANITGIGTPSPTQNPNNTAITTNPESSSPANNTSTTSTVSPIIIHQPTATIRPMGPIPPNTVARFFNIRTETDYLLASMIPVLLATLLSVPVQIFVTSLSSIIPFRALTNNHNSGGTGNGAHPEDSILLPRGGGNILFTAPIIAWRFLCRYKDPLPLAALLLSILSTVLVPLSSEVIRLEFTVKDCIGKTNICAFGLRKSGVPMRFAEGILVVMVVLILGIWFVLRRWGSGVASEPWSIASLASLGSTTLRIGSSAQPVDNSNARKSTAMMGLVRGLRTFTGKEEGCGRYMREEEMKVAMTGWRFKLAFEKDGRYGIMATKEEAASDEGKDDTRSIRLTVKDPPIRKGTTTSTPPALRRVGKVLGLGGNAADPEKQELSIRILALALTAGLLVLILHYETNRIDTPFERFMNGQSFGVRILFTTFGIALSSYWDYYFSQVSESQVYRRLSASPQPAHSSILLSPPSNLFVGIWRSLCACEIMFLNISFAALLAKFTPILFSNIPFRNTVTWKMHETCTWMAIGILSYMVFVLAASLPIWTRLTRMFGWKVGLNRSCYMPVKPDTIAAGLYYICDSTMMKDFEGMSLLARKERDRLVSKMGKKYVFGDVMGVSGTRRVAVDYHSGEKRKDIKPTPR